jgi:hypothetical protein
MKSFDLKMKSVEVKTTTRPIRTQWTAEMAADLSSYHNIDTSKMESILMKEMRANKRKYTIRKIYVS